MNDDQFTLLMDKLDELHGDFREHKGRTESEIANIKDDMKDAKKWENIKLLGTLFIGGLGHAVSKWRGI
jgi:hypothetical protein